MENYICINGKKAELTEEQMKALGIVLPNSSPFAMERDKKFYFISSYGSVTESDSNANRINRYEVGNYCTDESIMKKRALHETLNRLLWRYAMEHGANKMDWDNENECKYYLYFNMNSHIWSVGHTNSSFYFDAYFHTKESAENAIEEIIKPFMEAHPDFKF